MMRMRRQPAAPEVTATDAEILSDAASTAHHETVIVVRSTNQVTVDVVQRAATAVVRVVNPDPEEDWVEMISVLVLDGHATSFGAHRKAYVQCQPWLLDDATLVLANDLGAEEFAGVMIDGELAELIGRSPRFLALRLICVRRS